ncbi:Endochitinase [Actinidia chinensis var. chinensis]|uniref:Endochitinase n=1 Tax=Actinidia chinensis var. chinensis TaxID=1590841 RepID=A0A2R6QP56_ACTCC|nr:Endochitinase [Actinidia chinensis var. chinensis]
MSTEESAKKASRPQLVTLDKALKLAEQWVNNMTKSTEEEPAVVELEGRPARLGLGATVPRQPKVGPLNDPVERKLYAKLDVGKRKAAKNKEESSPSARERHDVKEDEDEDEDENESRTNLFVKKRVVPLTSSLQAKKKKK